MSVKKGDKVFFGKYSGTEITINGEKLLIMSENDIYGIIE
jgi:chaperonin GroES